jgi:hypothetical protein
MSKKIPALCALLMLASFAPAAASYASGELLFTFKDARITESSGVAPSSRRDDVFFTHNDSGDVPRFFAIRASDGATVGTYDVPDVPQALDWEDMSSGVVDGQPALFFADIGDNAVSRAIRPFVHIVVVAEPVVDPSKTVSADVPILDAFALAYEDGPHNAETLLVDPVTGQLAIVTKESSGRSGVYVARDEGARYVRTLHRVAVIDLSVLGSEAGLGNELFATGGDISPDGTRVTVRSYYEAFEWTMEDHDLGEGFAAEPQRISLPWTRQGEAIAYTRDGSSLITTSEGSHAPAHLLRRT